MMPNPYSVDLRWRIVWAHMSRSLTSSEIAEIFCVSERTVRCYITLFLQTGDIEPASQRHGPEKLFGDFEQVSLLKIILDHPGIYLFEIQDELHKLFGVLVSAPTICRTLKFMGCTKQVMHHVALQQSEVCRAKLCLRFQYTIQKCSYG